jgi:hypothetical protein
LGEEERVYVINVISGKEKRSEEDQDVGGLIILRWIMGCYGLD